MKKSTKGAVAAGTAAVLLLGGAGTVAFWSDSQSIGGGAINSGHLKLTNPTTPSWTLNGSPVADPTAVRIVPGDQLTYRGAFEIDAVGDNLQGGIAVTGGDEAGALAPFVATAPVAITVDGVAASTFTDENDGDTLAVTVGIDFPFGTEDNASNVAPNGLALNLTDLQVTVTQTDATP